MVRENGHRLSGRNMPAAIAHHLPLLLACLPRSSWSRRSPSSCRCLLQGDLVRVSAAGYWTGYYAQYFASHSWLEATANSFVIAFGSMVFTLLVALPAAFGFVRYRFGARARSTS